MTLPAQRAPTRKLRVRVVGMLIVLVVCLGIGAAVFFRPRQDAPKLQPPVLNAVLSPEPDESSGIPARRNRPLPAEVARLFTSAETHADRLALISDPSRDGHLMENFFREGPGADEEVIEVTAMGSATTEKAVFERFQVHLEDGGSRLLCIRISGQAGKVDFRSYARFCSEGWDTLLSGQSNIAEEVRVFIESGNAYIWAYSDGSEWTSYIATSPDVEMPLYFYTAKDSETERRLAEITVGGPMRATLAIRSKGDGHSHRQFEVTEVLTPGWVK